MPTMFDDERRARIVARLERHPEARPLWGRMSARDWGVFSHKHFDHHLRQFGA